MNLPEANYSDRLYYAAKTVRTQPRSALRLCSSGLRREAISAATRRSVPRFAGSEGDRCKM